MPLPPVACRNLLLLVCVLIGYGSLYPFAFERPGPDAWRTFFSAWGGHDSIGDLLGNIALFVPYGLLGTLAFRQRANARGRFIAVVLSGVVLAGGLQAAQLFTPTRDPALIDVVWNSLGIALGVLTAIPLARWTAGSGDGHGTLSMSGVLAGLWALSQLVPFVPSLDLQAFMDSLKPLFNGAPFSMSDTGIAAAGVLAAATLLASSTRPRRILFLLPLALLAIACAKILVISQHLDWETLIGWTLGYGAFLGIRPLPERTRFSICALSLLFGYTLTALEPFALRGYAGTFHLVPFADLLEGSMLSNATAVLPRLALFAMFLWLLRLMAGTVWPGAILLALWIGVLEVVQVILEGRTASITDSLLILLIGWILNQVRGVASGSVAAPGQRRDPTPEAAPPAPATTSEHLAGPTPPLPIRSTVLLAIAASAIIGLGVWSALRLPGVPYNVRELLLGDGHLLASWMFGLATLWIGAGGVLIGTRIANNRFTAVSIALWGLAVGVMMYAMLRSSVTLESISDISGSANLYWFVTNRSIWGETARELFLAMDGPGLVKFLERPVRFSALFAPLPIAIGIWWAVARQQGPPGKVARFAIMIFWALPTLLLCKGIAFDWSSTDNLNELLAYTRRDGYDGGAFLYGLLALITFVATRWVLWTSARSFALSALLTLASIPIGWWLLTHGLSQNISKYGNNFSGQQFLLGPDRVNLIPQGELFLRWSFAYSAAVLILAFGAWLGVRVFTARPPRGAGALPARMAAREATTATGALEPDGPTYIRLSREQIEFVRASAARSGEDFSSALSRILLEFVANRSPEAIVAAAGDEGGDPAFSGRGKVLNVDFDPRQELREPLRSVANLTGNSASRVVRRLLSRAMEPESGSPPPTSGATQDTGPARD